jgi:protein involved in temperature-dependent protein secretion
VTRHEYQRKVEAARQALRNAQAEVAGYLERGGTRNTERYGKLCDERDRLGSVLERVMGEGPKGE